MSGGGGGESNVSGGGGGGIDALARTKKEMKQTPEIKVRRKFPALNPMAQKMKLTPDMIEYTIFRLICLMFLEVSSGFLFGFLLLNSVIPVFLLFGCRLNFNFAV